MTHTRHFVRVGDRDVHYRRAGQGPVVVLLHACPKSSLEQAPLVDRLAAHFTALAFDMPGHGESDALPIEQPEVPDFAAALLDTLDALGVDRFLVYGRHTGSLIALEMATRQPARVARAIFDGFPVFSDDEKTDFLSGYLAPFQAFWDGIHLPATWARIRENYMLFPWHRADTGTRIDIDLPGPQMLHEVATDILRVGDQYRVGYASAFRYSPAPVLSALTVPTTIMARRDDLLFPHLERLPDLPPAVIVEPHTFDIERWAHRIEEIFLDADESGSTIPDAECRSGRHMMTCAETQLHVVRKGRGRPLLFLHDVPGSLMDRRDLIDQLAADRDVIAVDLPGTGLSDVPHQPGNFLAPLQALAARIAAPFDIYAEGMGGWAALALAADSDLVGKLVLHGPPMVAAVDGARMAASYVPDLAPRWDGGHLMTLWMALRDEGAYWPWFDRTRAAIIAAPSNRDAESLNRRFVSALISDDFGAYCRLALTGDIPALIAAQKDQVTLIAQSGTRWARCKEATPIEPGMAALLGAIRDGTASG